MSSKRGLLKSYNAGDHTATVQLASSYKVYMEGVAVAKNIPGDQMVVGRKLAVLFFDEHSSKEAVVVAVF